MPYSFHPYPVVSASKALLFMALVGVLAFFLHDYLGALFLPLLALAIIFGLLWAASAYAVAHACQITLDENEIIYRFGILLRHEYVLPYSKITEARFSQGLVDQVFGIGILSVDTPGFTDLPMRVAGVRMGDIRKTLDMINVKNSQTGTTNSK